MSTAAGHAPRRVTAAVSKSFGDFRADVSNSFVPLNTTCEDPDPFWGSIRSVDVDELHVSEVNAAGHVVERTPELIARSNRQYFKLSLQLEGSGILIQDNREVLLQPGDLAVYDTNRPYSLAFDSAFRTMVMMFPKHLIELPSHAVGQLTAVRISGGAGVGSLVVPFLSQLSDHLEVLTAPGGSRLARSALDLVTTMIANELDTGVAVRDPHRELMQSIHGYIDEHLASSDLGPGQIAAAHFISTRHLHGMFHEQGTTVSTWIRAKRLDRCHRDLVNPHLANRPVAAIAARWGFVDAAHFSRVFKACYGYAPSECRARAATE
ncbi:helix-turn-helix domain-containing protein [Cryobacterium zhongshanensis]|uniref:Helix-turn-helix domain-containing protein n=1 Tax=Cryobacterium zhongshanensis TaxID=2928153 RepID=A0AA41UEX2_9MICO|nr:helix-turn-helix domain-containing protein [Cryobacterium zhongshanensis]MCI4657893.1 helix-turn-helix domain-containing protein [Cryobacterium zhongshanensis]